MRFLAAFAVVLAGVSELIAAPASLSAPTLEPKIGYGSSTAVMSAAFQENVFQGFELAFAKSVGAQRATSLLAIRQVSDRSIQGAATSAAELIGQGVIALVGFPSSHDALLASDIAQRAGVLAIFGSPSHMALAEKGPLVYSTGASLSTLLDDVTSFLRKTFPGKKGLGVLNPQSVFSLNQEKLLRNKIGPGTGVDLELTRVNEALVLSDADLAKVRAKTYDYFYFTLYPDELIALLNQLASEKIDLPTVAFGGPDPGILRRFMATKKAPYYVGTSWVPGTPEMKALDAELRKAYRKTANFETVIGYNLGLVLGTVVNRVKGPLTKESIVSAFHKNRCFTVLAKQELCFGPAGGHAAKRSMHFMRFTPVGLELPKGS